MPRFSLSSNVIHNHLSFITSRGHPLSLLQAQTVIAAGPYAYLVSSDLPNLTFVNLRFSVKDGADFFINLSAEEYQGTAAFVSSAEQVGSV